MSKKKIAALGLLAAVLIGAAIFIQKARFDECRRVHPGWYCWLLITGRG
jgi:hypothetical protein